MESTKVPSINEMKEIKKRIGRPPSDPIDYKMEEIKRKHKADYDKAYYESNKEKIKSRTKEYKKSRTKSNITTKYTKDEEIEEETKEEIMTKEEIADITDQFNRECENLKNIRILMDEIESRKKVINRMAINSTNTIQQLTQRIKICADENNEETSNKTNDFTADKQTNNSR